MNKTKKAIINPIVNLGLSRVIIVMTMHFEWRISMAIVKSRNNQPAMLEFEGVDKTLESL